MLHKGVKNMERNDMERAMVLHKYEIYQNLQQSIQEKNLLLENIDIQVWYLKDSKTYGAVNQAYAEFLGVNKDNIDGESIYKILNEKAAKRCINNNKKVFTTKKQINKTEWVMDKNGDKRLLSITKAPCLDKSGEVKFVVCSAKDITSEHKLEKKLGQNRNYLQSIINTIPDIIILLDKKGDYLDLWTSRPEDLAAPKEELIGKNVNEVFSEEIAREIKKYCSRAINEDKMQTYEYKLEFPEVKKYFEAYFVSLDTNNNHKEILVTIRNITERKNLEQKLKEQNKLLEGVIDGIPDIIGIQKPDHTIIRYNQAGYEFFDRAPEEIKGKKCYELLGREEECEKCATRKALKSKKLEEVEKYLPKRDIYIKARSNPILDEEGNVTKIIEQLQDITERKNREKKIKQLSFHDQLTGLYNRRYFENEMERLNKSRKIPISIIMADIDNLKYVNDNYGHAIGDKYIKKAGELFNNCVRESDIIARVGGDEFSVILPEMDLKTAKKLFKRIKKKCKNFNKNIELPEPLKISLGAATKASKNEDLDIIYAQADKKMYENKGRT